MDKIETPRTLETEARTRLLTLLYLYALLAAVVFGIPFAILAWRWAL